MFQRCSNAFQNDMTRVGSGVITNIVNNSPRVRQFCHTDTSVRFRILINVKVLLGTSHGHDTLVLSFVFVCFIFSLIPRREVYNCIEIGKNGPPPHSGQLWGIVTPSEDN
jgi:hypothetical protein